MTARELFEAIGQVDDDLILAADAPVHRRPAVRVWVRRALPAAACLCVMLLGGVALGRSGLFRAGSSAPAESSAAVTYEALRQQDFPGLAADGPAAWARQKSGQIRR